MMDLQGKTALITGSAVRIGRAIALALVEEGCNLMLHYHASQEKVMELKAEVEQAGVSAFPIKANLMDYEETETLIPHCLEFVPQVDILINSAALYLNANGTNTTRKQWEDQMALNLRTPFQLIQSFAKNLPKGVQGKIVNIADAKVFHKAPDHFVYRLTKTALLEMTKLFALELAPDITVNALALGIMMPLAGHEHVDMEAVADRRIPLKRIGGPEIAAQNVLHILKQDFMTGTFLRIDGGENIS